MTGSALFRFDAIEHAYIDLGTGRELPHITGMLKAAGYVDDRWFTDESRDRGSAVHRLTADYDLGALEDVASCTSRYRPYLLGHVAALERLRPEMLQVEEPLVHPVHHYGGRPDRVCRIFGALAILEIKTGGEEKSHRYQTALQAILAEQDQGLPAEMFARYVLHLKPNGKFKVLEHTNRADFAEAQRIIKTCCADSWAA